MNTPRRNNVRKSLVKQEDGLYHVPCVGGYLDNQRIKFTNRKHVMKFRGAYILQYINKKVVYYFNQDRDEMLRLRELRKREKAYKRALTE